MLISLVEKFVRSETSPAVENNLWMMVQIHKSKAFYVSTVDNVMMKCQQFCLFASGKAINSV